ncbi:molybdopterin molybdotransferase MoeA [Curtobacterium sp. VKM Ac-2922]|uniref:molybdopterin molybdotransferase MoeA n=1 Tax=Curtobacterium sp. VKM Ac-2922 TaxID=2929475 RepID=UPI001FB498AD|nr:molybdopterin molybdotransferase MoeA [Curtobacterium sp. VKM Ac-2922]MCJ1715817.1 molybdopterin molybdotransferase MoeA [Curtobacterium sp. VKM Ac-2922]
MTSHLSWSAARDEAHRQGSLLTGAPVTLDLVASLGRTLAADVRAPGAVPAHDGAAMDGWAVAGAPPWRLGAAIVAGAAPSTRTLEPGHARPVTTGAPVPPGTTSVVRSEDAHVDDTGRLVQDTVSTRRHIRPAGEEVTLGDLLVRAGSVLTPPRAALAAASGVDRVSLAPAPTVRVAVLGDEIVGAGVPQPGQVRDVFTHTLPGILRSFGADPVGAVRVPDDRAATTAALAGTGARLVVTTGGTAGSSTDHVRGALDAIGAQLLLDRVEVRPGRPMLLARRDDTLYLCLPGNPMAAMVGAVLLGEPLVAGLLGRPPAPTSTVRLAVDVPNDRPGALVLAYVLDDHPDGDDRDHRAVPANRQTSAMLRGLADADGLMVVPTGGASAGDVVPTLRLPWS